MPHIPHTLQLIIVGLFVAVALVDEARALLRQAREDRRS